MTDADRLEEARELALSYLDRRMRSERELRGYLGRKGAPREIVDRVLTDLAERGFVDDHRYAVAFTRDRVRLAPRGYRLIAAELRSRGIAPDAVAAAIAEVEAEHPEPEVARSLFAKRRRRFAALDAGVARRRAAAWLESRGFRGETIERVTDEMKER
jgi:regulatory protein